MIETDLFFEAKGQVLMTDKYDPVDHRKPTWDQVIYSGDWHLEKDALVIHWDGNGEHPLGLITKFPLLEVSPHQFRWMEGEHGALTYKRVK